VNLTCNVALCWGKYRAKQLIPQYWIILAYQDINQGSLIKHKCKTNSKNVE